MTERYWLTPIGRVRSALRTREEAPRQGRDTGQEAWIDVLPAYGDGLEGLGSWPEIQVVCWLHQADRDLLRLRPRGNPEAPLTGVFATRSPNRPNPVAVYTVTLREQSGLSLRVAGIDALDGTPVVDLRPHIHRLDDCGPRPPGRGPTGWSGT